MSPFDWLIFLLVLVVFFALGFALFTLFYQGVSDG